MLRAGAASVDITPTEVRSTYMAGFGMGRRARGVHMPLEASAVYIESGEDSVVLVSLDLVGLLKVWIDRIRAAVTAVPGERVIVACTHTHSGPDTMGYWGPSILKVFPRSDGKNPAYMHGLVDAVAAMIDRAVENATEVVARFADVEIDPKWTRNDRKGGGRFDHATAVALENAHTRVATVLNFASHPETLWEHNHLLSPDYVGPLRERFRSTRGGETVFLNGPLGAMLTPNCDAPERDVAARIRFVERLGEAVADTVNAALDGAEAHKDAPLRHERSTVRFANTNWRFRLLERLGLVDVVTRDQTVTSQVHAVTLGPLSLLTAPGEVCPELGARIRERTPGRYPMLACLCEDEFGYILEPSMFDESEYGYEVTMSLGRETAETLLAAYGSALNDAPSAPEADV